MMRDVLERALAADPDDAAAHAAYADYLIEQGDPRGEFVRVQLALEDESLDRPARQRLKRQEERLLAAHQREWLGDLAPVLLEGRGLHRTEYGPGDYEDYDPTGERAARWRFRRGWLASLTNLWLAVPAARVIARAPQTRLLEELAVEYACDADEMEPFDPGDDVPTWERDRVQFVSLFPLLKSQYLGNVRRLRLGFDPEVTGESSYAFGHAAADLVAGMPRVEELRLFTRGVDARRLFALRSLTRLRRLDYYHDHHYPLRVLADNPALGSLERLDCFPHGYVDREDQRAAGAERGSYLPLEEVTPLFRSRHLPSLRHLALRESSMGDDGVEALIESGMLDRLRVLDLRNGAVTAGGAELLARCEAAGRLDRLDLSDNALTPAGVRLLRDAGVRVTADDQHPPGDDRYLYIGEFE